VIKIWRGVQGKKSMKDPFWTVDRSRAEWFATRFTSKRILAEGIVKKEDVYALFLRRDGTEIVADNVCIQRDEKIIKRPQ
jgi:hypothetical protein